MADFYVDHLAYPAYAAVPSGAGWPLPAQDGDGLAPGLAVSAIASINCTGITAAATNTLAIMGATLTCVASGAAANQFNAGSGTTLAANIVSAIAAATNTVNSGSSVTLPQLREMVYARVDPGNANIVQIMTRAGGAIFNHAANASVALAVAGFSPTLVQFSGGVSGAWGYLWNDTVLWPTAKAAATYGAGRVNQTSGGGLLGASRALTISDVVWLRAKDQELLYNTRTHSIFTPWIMVLDANNEKWGGTLGKTMTIGREASTAGSVTRISVQPGAGIAAPMQFMWASNARHALKQTQRNLVTNTASTGHSQFYFNTATGGFAIFDGVWFEDTSPFNYHLGWFIENSWAGDKSVFLRRWKYTLDRTASTWSLNVFGSSPTGPVGVVGQDGDAVFALATSHPGLIDASLVSALMTHSYVLRSCRCSSPNGVIPPFKGGAGALVRGENLQGFSPGPVGIFGLRGGGGDYATAVLSNVGPKQGARMESCSTQIEWTPDAGFPTYRAQLLDATPWSWRATWTNSASAFVGGTLPVDQVQLTKAAPLSTAVRTVTMEILVDALASAVTNTQIALSVAYTDNTGVLRTESTLPPLAFINAGTAIPSSTAPWVMGSYGAHLKRKLELTTAHPVAAGSQVSATMQFVAPSPGAPTFVFVDPEMEVA